MDDMENNLGRFSLENASLNQEKKYIAVPVWCPNKKWIDVDIVSEIERTIIYLNKFGLAKKLTGQWDTENSSYGDNYRNYLLFFD